MILRSRINRMKPNVKFFIIGLFAGVFLSGILTVAISSHNSKTDLAFFPTYSENTQMSVSSKSTCLVDSSLSTVKKIDINSASINELISLPGIGESKANNIVDFRMKYGNFKTIDEIIYVSGISENLFQNIFDLITITSSGE